MQFKNLNFLFKSSDLLLLLFNAILLKPCFGLNILAKSCDRFVVTN